MCLEIHESDPAPSLTWQAALNKAKTKLDLLLNWYVINDKKGIRVGICHTIHRYAKANNKYMKEYDKNKE